MLLLFFILLTVSLVKAGDYRRFPEELFDVPLKFHPLNVNINIPLHSVIIMPSLREEGFLSIEFPRAELEEKFIRDLFYKGDRNVVKIHPFAHGGIEAILTRDKLVLNIHSGVILHLRNDMNFFPNYKTFKSEKVNGRVTEAKGKVLCSFDHLLIKERLNNVFVWGIGPSASTKPETRVYKQPDGSYMIIMPFDEKTDFPPEYPPKIIEDQKERRE